MPPNTTRAQNKYGYSQSCLQLYAYLCDGQLVWAINPSKDVTNDLRIQSNYMAERPEYPLRNTDLIDYRCSGIPKQFVGDQRNYETWPQDLRNIKSIQVITTPIGSTNAAWKVHCSCRNRRADGGNGPRRSEQGCEDATWLVSPILTRDEQFYQRIIGFMQGVICIVAFRKVLGEGYAQCVKQASLSPVQCRGMQTNAMYTQNGTYIYRFLRLHEWVNVAAVYISVSFQLHFGSW